MWTPRALAVDAGAPGVVAAHSAGPLARDTARAVSANLLDDERVLVLVKLRGRGKTSGADLGQMHGKGAGLFNIRDGKATKYVEYCDRDRALVDLDLEG
jgi:hypothetical protein